VQILACRQVSALASFCPVARGALFRRGASPLSSDRYCVASPALQLRFTLAPHSPAQMNGRQCIRPSDGRLLRNLPVALKAGSACTGSLPLRSDGSPRGTSASFPRFASKRGCFAGPWRAKGKCLDAIALVCCRRYTVVGSVCGPHEVLVLFLSSLPRSVTCFSRFIRVPENIVERAMI